MCAGNAFTMSGAEGWPRVLARGCIVLAAWVALVPSGGIVNLFTQVRQTAPELLSRPGLKGLYTDKYWVMQFIVLPFGIWLCPHVWNKSLMARDEEALARSAISIPISQLLIYGFSTLFIGLAGHILVSASEVHAADNILPILMLKYSNWFIAEKKSRRKKLRQK